MVINHRGSGNTDSSKPATTSPSKKRQPNTIITRMMEQHDRIIDRNEPDPFATTHQTGPDSTNSPDANPRKELLKFRWQKAILKSDMPPLARLVALVHFAHMNCELALCYPGLDLLEEETGLARATVVKFRTALIDNGWLLKWTLGEDRKESGKAAGRNWARYQLAAVIPTASKRAAAVWPGSPKSRREHGDNTDEVVHPVNHLKGRGSSPDSAEVVHPVNPNMSVNSQRTTKIQEGGGKLVEGKGARARDAGPTVNDLANRLKAWTPAQPTATKLIEEGTSPEDLESCIAEFREIYARTVRQPDDLDQAFEKFAHLKQKAPSQPAQQAA